MRNAHEAQVTIWAKPTTLCQGVESMAPVVNL
jgi:hypothetical protein